MNDQELKELWQRQKIETAAPVDPRAQIEAMRAKISKLHRGLYARDFREWAACAVIIIAFGIYFFTTPYLLTRIADVIIIGGALFISWKLMDSRRRAPRPDAAAPVAVWLKQEQARVHHEAELLRTVHLWYLLPLWLGVTLFVWGLPNGIGTKISFTVLNTLMYVWIYWLNQWARRKRLLPLQDELENLLQNESQASPSGSGPGLESNNPTSPKPSTSAEDHGFHLQFSRGNNHRHGFKLVVGSREVRLFEPKSTNSSNVKTNRLLAIEWIFAALGLGLGFLAWTLGLFMNFIFVLLLGLAPINLIRLAWGAWKKNIYWGLLTKPLAADSRRFYWPCLARIAFFAACGYLLEIAVVPYQFPEDSPAFWRTMTWSLALFQIALSFFPARRAGGRIFSPRALLYSCGALFMAWQFIQIAQTRRAEAIVLSSPLPGISAVVQGGKSSLINHHYPIRSQRHAVDLFKVAENMEDVRAWNILEMDDSFGQAILSPCGGRIAHVEEGHPDNAKGETNTRDPAGNYLTIEIAPGRYILIAHLKSKSITVQIGDQVTIGQAIAQCGNSGNTSGSHVHLQAQSTPALSRDTQTFPIAFRNLVRNGEPRLNLQPRRNDLLVQPE